MYMYISDVGADDVLLIYMYMPTYLLFAHVHTDMHAHNCMWDSLMFWTIYMYMPTYLLFAHVHTYMHAHNCMWDSLMFWCRR